MPTRCQVGDDDVHHVLDLNDDRAKELQLADLTPRIESMKASHQVIMKRFQFIRYTDGTEKGLGLHLPDIGYL